MKPRARWVVVHALVGLTAMASSACGGNSRSDRGGGSGSSAGGSSSHPGGDSSSGSSAAGTGNDIGGGGSSAASIGGGSGTGGSAVRCEGSSSTGGVKSYCETLRAKERCCEVLTEGITACADFYDAAEPCEISCIERAKCSEISNYYCGVNTAALGTCYSSCIGRLPFDCGDGSKVPGWARCSGSVDCLDASDEAGCDASNSGYKCRNVDQFVPVEKLCDGTKDCSDGSDENAECAQRTCKVNGVDTQLDFNTLCDGNADCDDASDEPADCAALRCPL
ncbi:MAG TPA: hypothetical protein VFK05_04380 [Polyangiaceae bacterium]|nr:hypothetical protein [Polyangiaceae bacterium]